MFSVSHVFVHFFEKQMISFPLLRKTSTAPKIFDFDKNKNMKITKPREQRVLE